jgi:hypothetical protein
MLLRINDISLIPDHSFVIVEDAQCKRTGWLKWWKKDGVVVPLLGRKKSDASGMARVSISFRPPPDIPRLSLP